MMKEKIKSLIKEVLKNLGIKEANFVVGHPDDLRNGDYFTNAAMVYVRNFETGQDKPSRMEVAETIGRNIKDKDRGVLFEEVDVASPGFINFYLKKEIFNENTKQILKDKSFGKNNSLKSRKIIIEYTDPNILKEFHIGHLMSNAIGESLSRIFEFNGGKVKRANYQGDVGLHVAKAIWGILKQGGNFLTAYAYGHKAYTEYPQAKIEIEDVNKKLYNRTDSRVNLLYDAGKENSLEYFKTIYKKLGTKFDYYFFESKVASVGKKIVQENIGKIFEKGEKGAIIFKGEAFGLHTRVFINSEGLPTYEAKELALVREKYKKYKYDQSVVVTANEINEYFKVLMAAMSQIFPELAKKTTHIGHGMMRLPEGKMSSRTGKVITFEFLLDEVENLIREKIKERDLSEKEKKEIIEKVAIGALKYSILKQSIGSDIIYDANKSVSFEGDSGPYLQYSYARAMSVLKKAKSEKINPSLKNNPSQIIQLERMMIYFPEIVQKAGKEYQPHYIALYLIELAREFNNYYAHTKIVDKEDAFSPYKVALTQAFSIIIKNGLWLLGIEAPEKM